MAAKIGVFNKSGGLGRYELRSLEGVREMEIQEKLLGNLGLRRLLTKMMMCLKAGWDSRASTSLHANLDNIGAERGLMYSMLQFL
jgi:hypothetical protein